MINNQVVKNEHCYRVLGVDPGLNNTGWGVINYVANTAEYINAGIIKTDVANSMPVRLEQIFHQLHQVIKDFSPQVCAIEETYVNKNFASSLKLAQAKAIALLVAQNHGLSIISYQAKQVKKVISGYGSADKTQMRNMIKLLLPKAGLLPADSADAIAIALCHSIITR